MGTCCLLKILLGIYALITAVSVSAQSLSCQLERDALINLQQEINRPAYPCHLLPDPMQASRCQMSEAGRQMGNALGMKSFQERVNAYERNCQ
jgi:hypothetical protein